MGLEKIIDISSIEVVGKFKSVQVCQRTKILDNGVEISESFHRHVIDAGADYSVESAEVQSICAIVHTEEVIAAREAAYPSE